MMNSENALSRRRSVSETRTSPPPPRPRLYRPQVTDCVPRQYLATLLPRRCARDPFPAMHLRWAPRKASRKIAVSTVASSSGSPWEARRT